jgi:hypothetical protein
MTTESQALDIALDRMIDKAQDDLLHAAAPDLLAVCQACKHQIATDADLYEPGLHACDNRQIYESLDRALSKAIEAATGVRSFSSEIGVKA